MKTNDVWGEVPRIPEAMKVNNRRRDIEEERMLKDAPVKWWACKNVRHFIKQQCDKVTLRFNK